ncbi:MAG: thiol-disulfide oxidoreductase DCC family protein [Bacteroidota bacterium]|nr:thiol-disulfide oxidoreductase DCC family protein [Bacteroidota bacterium]
MDNRTENIILFDGVCNLCNGLVRFIIKRDAGGKFKFASLQSEIGQQWLRTVGLPVNEFESFVLIRGDEYYLKSTGALKMLRELDGIWRTFYIFILVPRPVRDFLYDMVAKSRYKIFGKRDTCMIPTPELQERFL